MDRLNFILPSAFLLYRSKIKYICSTYSYPPIGLALRLRTAGDDRYHDTEENGERVAAAGETAPSGVIRRNSCSLRDQAIFMVQTAENWVSYDLKVVWNAVSMFVRRDRKSDWRIRDAWPEATVGPTSVVMFDPVFCNDA